MTSRYSWKFGSDSSSSSRFRFFELSASSAGCASDILGLTEAAGSTVWAFVLCVFFKDASPIY